MTDAPMTPEPLMLWVVTDAKGNVYHAKNEKVARGWESDWNAAMPCDAPHRAVCMVPVAEVDALRSALSEQREANEECATKLRESGLEAVQHCERADRAEEACRMALAAMDDAATVRNRMTGAEGRAIDYLRAVVGARAAATTNEGGK